MNDHHLARVLRSALPEYEKTMAESNFTAFMCHILENRHRQGKLGVFELKEALKRIRERIDNNITLFTYLNETQGRVSSLDEENQRALAFWHEWIAELETEQQPVPLPKLPAPKIKTYKKVTNMAEIMEELHKHSPKVQARMLKAYMHELEPDDKGVFMCTKEFSKWCRDNIDHIEESLKEDD